MKRFTRIMSMFLAIIMIAGILPLAVIAEDIQSTHTVKFSLNYNGAKTIPSQKIEDGECASEPENATRTGYILKGWYTKKNGGDKFDFAQPIHENVTLYAQWNEDPAYYASIWNKGIVGAIESGKKDDTNSEVFTVTFDANGSDVENLPAPQQVKKGECATEPDAPTKLIHEFDGWYIDSECTVQYDFSKPVTSDITLYAKWNITIYSKSIDENHVKTGTLEFEGEEYEGMYIDNEVLIVVENGVGRDYIEQLVKPYGGTVVGQIPTIGYYQVELDKGYVASELEELCCNLMNDSKVEDAYLNTVLEYTNDAYYPNDPFSTSRISDINTNKTLTLKTDDKWKHLSTWGLRACNVPEAWEIVNNIKKNPSVRMGVIDDSVDANHEDLNIIDAYRRDEKFDPYTVGAIYPYDAAHGTHVAGIMGAINNNGKGISGVSLNAELIIASERIKQGDAKNHLISIGNWNCDLAQLILSEVKVINISLGIKETKNWNYQWGVKSAAARLKRTLDEFIDDYNFLIVTAAGNEATDDDDKPLEHDVNYHNQFCNISEEYLKNRIIVVGNAMGTLTSDITNKYLRSLDSSYLGGRVDIMAPGHNIYSTVPSNYEDRNNEYDPNNKGYALMSGTSMASPFVAGLAGLIWEANPELSAERVKEIIVSTANIPVDDSDVNMVNAEAALIEALGYDPRVGTVNLKFVDVSTNSELTCQSLTADPFEYSGNAIPEYAVSFLNEQNLKLTSEGNCSSARITLPYGKYSIKFSAEGYHDYEFAGWDKFMVDSKHNEYIISMLPYEYISPVKPGDIIDSGECGDSLTYTLNNQGTLIISGSGEMWDWQLYNGNVAPWYDNRHIITNVIINTGVTSIGTMAFFGCTALESIDIPNSITLIGDSAFDSCTTLKSIELPNSITSIWRNLFNSCKSLESIVIPDSITSIREAAFANCKSLTDVYFKGDVPSKWGEDIFYGVSPYFTFTIHYIDSKLGWTTPTWTAPDGTVYNTAIWNP